MNKFLDTHKLYKADSTVTLPDHADRVPTDLLTLMRQVNSNSYANGFFKFIPLDSFTDYFSLWNLNPADCLPFLKCAFGHLVFYHEDQYKVLNPVHNDVDILGEKDELDFVMDIALCDREALEASFLIDIYEQAFSRLGAPALDEIYAFVPALLLGGSRDPANVHKKKMQEEMMILAQL